MKILHVGNPANIALNITEKLIEYGCYSHVLLNDNCSMLDCRESFHISKVPPPMIVNYLVGNLKHFDVIHLHNLEFFGLAPQLKQIDKDKPIVTTIHGDYSCVDDFWKQAVPQWRAADVVTVPHKFYLDHAPDSIKHIPLFVNKQNYVRLNAYIDGMSLYIDHTWLGDQTKALKIIMKLPNIKDFNIRTQIRNQTMFPPSVFHRFLELFEYFFDIRVGRTGNIYDSLCTTSLEQLTLGGKVIDQYGTIHNKISKENEPDRVIKQWVKIYTSVM